MALTFALPKMGG